MMGAKVGLFPKVRSTISLDASADRIKVSNNNAEIVQATAGRGRGLAFYIVSSGNIDLIKVSPRRTDEAVLVIAGIPEGGLSCVLQVVNWQNARGDIAAA
jgi:hypothetical protein